jgi:hypothetical protein
MAYQHYSNIKAEILGVSMTDILPQPAPVSHLSERDRKLNRVIECTEFLRSYATSAGEAAWRGDEGQLETDLKAARVSLMEAIKVFKEVKP